MQPIKYLKLNDKDFANHIRDLINESSYFKGKIFKAFIRAEDIKKDVVTSYKNFIKDFIDIWEDYANDIVSKMKTTNAVKGTSTISYSYIKDYIYSVDDYASILQFTDGIIKGIESKQFYKPEDIDNFFKFTVNSAFHDKGNTVATLIDAVMVNGISVDMVSNTSDWDVEMFNVVKNYKIFKPNEALELYRSIDKVLEYITNDMSDVIRSIKGTDIKLFISIINNIVEYITYSITAYTSRIYIISRYIYSFINDSNEVHSMAESGSQIELTENDITVNIMMISSEASCRKPEYCKQFMQSMDTFTKAMGTDTLFGTNKPKPGTRLYKSLINADNVLVIPSSLSIIFSSSCLTFDIFNK